jgi:NAD(P)H-dependent flavin oxidoreductase YrpB (nitropropane dioxygenase family)
MNTRLCELFDIELPIIQAAMGGVGGPRLAAAVSNAGGLGMLALWYVDPEVLRQKIQETRALTERPFGVNLNLTWPQEERLAVCLEEGVPVISFFWGDPGPLVESARSGRAKILHTSASAAEARRMADLGVDAVVAQGWEAGGHVRGVIASMPLIPAVADAIKPTPVVAAGGIADGRGLAAALALGAAGAWIGTRFLLSEEASIHPRYAELLIGARETDTYYGELFDVNWPNAAHRVLRNKTVDAWEEIGRPRSGERPGEGEVVATSPEGQILRYQSVSAAANITGDIDALSLWAGQGVGLVSKVQPAGEIVREIADEAMAILKRLSAGLG